MQLWAGQQSLEVTQFLTRWKDLKQLIEMNASTWGGAEGGGGGGGEGETGYPKFMLPLFFNPSSWVCLSSLFLVAKHYLTAVWFFLLLLLLPASYPLSLTPFPLPVHFTLPFLITSFFSPLHLFLCIFSFLSISSFLHTLSIKLLFLEHLVLHFASISFFVPFLPCMVEPW